MPERGKHSRAHVPHRHRSKSKGGRHRQRGNKKGGGRQDAQMVKRHDHGSNDDRTDEVEEHDRSKTHFLRVHRAVRSCIAEATEEVDHLMAKYSGLCGRHHMCNRDGLDDIAKQSMKDLFQKRQRLYREYMSASDQCYGSIAH